MANRTDVLAASIHGTNPQNLVEKILRTKVYQTVYWKESCFALTAETVIEKAIELKSVGGTFGGTRRPTNFMCLVLKMLQIQPEKEIIIEYIKNETFKYVRVLGTFYMRLVGKPMEVYQYLEPLYNDYRKIRLQSIEGAYVLSHVDELIDDMLRKDYLFDIALPRVPARLTLEKAAALDPRISVLDEEFDEAVIEMEAGAGCTAGGCTCQPPRAAPVGAPAQPQPGAPPTRTPSRQEQSHDDYDSRHRETGRSSRGGAEDDGGGYSRADAGGYGRDGGSSGRDRNDRNDRDDRDARERRDDDGGRSNHREERGGRDSERERGSTRGEERGGDGGRDRRSDRGGERDGVDGGRERGRDRDREDRKGSEGGRASGGGSSKGAGKLDEIAEANAMRAKLGLKPLK
ncbi:MAG: hypothetical protein WDW38_009038 [Sanguina aurantia]